MPDWLNSVFGGRMRMAPTELLLRLLLAFACGWVVALIYRRTRRVEEISPSFPPTLVLLAIMIAMVTQVVGDSVARAFSLVGALSIVRFRTVVRDTQDTAFVIFAVVEGMAVGASDLWVALAGLGVVALAAHCVRSKRLQQDADLFLLTLRTSPGHDLEKTLAPVAGCIEHKTMRSIETARQGLALEHCYRVALRPGMTPENFVKQINQLEGIQNVSLARIETPSS